MANIKHSKLRNTGLLFEFCVRQITDDTINDRVSPATDIIRKYFSNTELMKEYLLYQAISKSTNLSETKADILITSVLTSYNKLDHKKIKEHKYNLVKEIKKHYNEEQFFKSNVPSYRLNATIYTLFELNSNQIQTDPYQLISVRSSLLEHVCRPAKQTVDNEWKSLDKGMKNLTFKIMVENFNKTFNSFTDSQKSIIHEYIKCISTPDKMIVTLNTTLYDVKKSLAEQYHRTADKITKIKLKEVINSIVPYKKGAIIKESDVISALQYCELLSELQKANESK
jgi:hypothetical protein